MGSPLRSELVLAFKGKRYPRAVLAVYVGIAKLSWRWNGFTCVSLELILHLLEEFIFELFQNFVIILFSSV